MSEFDRVTFLVWVGDMFVLGGDEDVAVLSILGDSEAVGVVKVVVVKVVGKVVVCVGFGEGCTVAVELWGRNVVHCHKIQRISFFCDINIVNKKYQGQSVANG